MLEKFPRFSIPRYGLLPNTPVNNAELNLAELFRKFPQLCFNEKQMDFGCLVTCSIRETFCERQPVSTSEFVTARSTLLPLDH